MKPIKQIIIIYGDNTFKGYNENAFIEWFKISYRDYLNKRISEVKKN